MSGRCWLARACLALALCAPLAGWAMCQRHDPVDTEDHYAAPIPFGRLNLDDPALQPPGTLLAATIVPPTNYTGKGAHANSVLWTCDPGDLPDVYFLVSTNGDDRVGGHYDVSTLDDPGLPGVHATWFAHVGIKLTMQGVVLSRWYQKIPLDGYDEEDGKIKIRLRHVPLLRAEFYRIRSIPPKHDQKATHTSAHCDGLGILGLGRASAQGTTYVCQQPNAYIQLHGPGLTSDRIGDDHNRVYHFWGADNGFAYSMWKYGAVSQRASCVVRNNTPVVTFPTVSAQQLMQGTQLTQQFSVRLACSHQVESGVHTGQTAIGIQVSPGAWRAAQALGLVNGSGGVTHLVADDYASPNTARGVGVTLQNPAMAAGNLHFLSANLGENMGGRRSGWYPVLDGAIPTGTTPFGTQEYLHTFTATLGRVYTEPVTPGTFQASATIMVKIQ